MKYRQDLYNYQRIISQTEEESHLHEKGEKIFQSEREKEIFNYDASNFKDNINDESEFLNKVEDDNFGSYNSRFKQSSMKDTVSEELMTLVSIGEEI
jgi:hypothetical protein